jgi:hypothetical protein
MWTYQKYDDSIEIYKDKIIFASSMCKNLDDFKYFLLDTAGLVVNGGDTMFPCCKKDILSFFDMLNEIMYKNNKLKNFF